jgi:hypothetical protein
MAVRYENRFKFAPMRCAARSACDVAGSEDDYGPQYGIALQCAVNLLREKGFRFLVTRGQGIPTFDPGHSHAVFTRRDPAVYYSGRP